MDVSTLLISLIAIDVLLCAAVLFLLVQSISTKKKNMSSDGMTNLHQQLQEMLSRSQEDLQAFQDAISEGQSSLEELIRQIDEREKSLRALLEEANREVSRRQAQGFSSELKETQCYKDATLLIHQGKTDQEIIRECGITEGELALIKGLLGIRNEGA
jgi:septal ring factor EnvC (AmiA/AmiB activator)